MGKNEQEPLFILESSDASEISELFEIQILKEMIDSDMYAEAITKAVAYLSEDEFSTEFKFVISMFILTWILPLLRLSIMDVEDKKFNTILVNYIKKALEILPFSHLGTVAANKTKGLEFMSNPAFQADMLNTVYSLLKVIEKLTQDPDLAVFNSNLLYLILGEFSENSESILTQINDANFKIAQESFEQYWQNHVEEDLEESIMIAVEYYMRCFASGRIDELLKTILKVNKLGTDCLSYFSKLLIQELSRKKDVFIISTIQKIANFGKNNEILEKFAYDLSHGLMRYVALPGIGVIDFNQGRITDIPIESDDMVN